MAVTYFEKANHGVILKVAKAIVPIIIELVTQDQITINQNHPGLWCVFTFVFNNGCGQHILCQSKCA